MNIMKHCCIVAALVSVIVGAAGAAGCRNRADPVEQFSGGVLEEAPRSGGLLRSAPADIVVSAPARPYFAAGLGLLVAGGLAAIVGAKTMGFAAMGLGAAVAALGVVIVRYPWAILLAFLLAVGTAGVALFDRWRKQRALVATTTVIQTLPEGKAIKQGLADLGAEIEAQVRAVVTPIKERLKVEGKI